ncbi:MAG: hypothetical protein M1820_000249 [Bogoriella megaspora]|nr:MAG: hypothetical protein M1820_000249 [Bogoriella megaspora]
MAPLSAASTHRRMDASTQKREIRLCRRLMSYSPDGSSLMLGGAAANTRTGGEAILPAAGSVAPGSQGRRPLIGCSPLALAPLEEDTPLGRHSGDRERTLDQQRYNIPPFHSPLSHSQILHKPEHYSLTDHARSLNSNTAKVRDNGDRPSPARVASLTLPTTLFLHLLFKRVTLYGSQTSPASLLSPHTQSTPLSP